MKKISERTIEQLKAISPDELAAHGIIGEAPNHKGRNGYICPFCGSGTGRNHHGRQGDGAGSFDADNKFFCHACCNESVGRHKLSAIDLFAISRHLQHESFAEQCRQMAIEFNVYLSFDELNDLPRRRRSTKIAAKTATAPAKSAPKSDKEKKAELKFIRQDLSADDDALANFVRDVGGTWRGLPAELLQKHGCKFAEQWTHPTSRAENKFATPTPRVLIPAGDDGYLARLTCSVDDFDDNTRQYVKPKQHAGTKRLFNPDALNATEPIFVVEGYIDAMSIEFAGYHCVALGGAERGDLLVDAVNKMTSKPKIIILLDADDAGRKAAPDLRDELINFDSPCVVRFLSDETSKIDANEILTMNGVDVLRGKLQAIFDNSLSEIDAVADELANRHEERISDDDLNFLFDGDASDLDFARRFERIFGNHVRWLSDEERWLVYGSGVWTRGGTTNSCVQPFARNVGDIMSRYAQNDDERKLADRLKNSRKVSTSITMMKSLDSILITQDDLDNHAELLNVANGVVNLQDGKLYPHAPEILLTQQCRADYDANANSPLVEKFFRDIMPDEQTRAGLLRWLGYCLTGETSAEKFMIWHGGGANGKGVLSKTLLYLLDSYGAGLAPRALLKSNRFVDANNATTSLNPLENARFAISEELPADAELDSSLVKNLTGGDKINLRRNFDEYRTIENHAKINISGNYLPKIENTADDGLLRRLLNMPFTVKFGTPQNPADDALKRKMLSPEHLRGLLSLLVREAVCWYRGDDGGLIISSQMSAEREKLLRQSDFVGEFVDDFYIRSASASVKAKDFLDDLKRAYPRECSRFSRADLIRLVERAAGVTYCEDRKRNRIFKGIGKAAPDDFGGEPISSSDYNPYD